MTSSSRGPRMPSSLPDPQSLAECRGVALNGVPLSARKLRPHQSQKDAQYAGSPPQPRTSPQMEGDAGGAGVNQFGTNVVVLERWHPSPIDLTIQLGRMSKESAAE